MIFSHPNKNINRKQFDNITSNDNIFLTSRQHLDLIINIGNNWQPYKTAMDNTMYLVTFVPSPMSNRLTHKYQ